MPLFELKSLSQECSLGAADECYRASRRVEQFRLGEDAIFFGAFPGNRYLPFAALDHVRTKNTAISVIGTCGKQLPMVCLRMHYDGEFYKDFLFEKQKSADKVLEAVAAARPELTIDRDTTPFGG